MHAKAEGSVLSEACPDCCAAEVLCLRDDKRVFCHLCGTQQYRYDRCIQCGRQTVIRFFSLRIRFLAFAMPYTMLRKGHVAVEVLVQNLSRGKQLIVETLTHLVSVSLFLMLVWQAIILARDMKATGEVTPTLLLPFYPIVYCIAVSFFCLCLAILVNLLHIWMNRA